MMRIFISETQGDRDIERVLSLSQEGYAVSMSSPTHTTSSPISLHPRLLATLRATEACHKLLSGTEGLSEVEATRRAMAYTNLIPRPHRSGIFQRFASQFKSPLILILLIIAIIVPLIGEMYDAIVILIVILFNAIIGVIQEGRASQALEALEHSFIPTSSVYRDGHERTIPSQELVIGDIVTLHEGDQVPADGRIIEQTGLRIDESMLTGESAPVNKTHESLTAVPTLALGDLRNAAFRQTLVVTGHGKMVISAVGKDTEVGHIASSLNSRPTQPPLVKKIQQLSRWIALLVGLFSCALFFFGLAVGRPTLVLIATIASLVVSIIPEGLPIVLTLVLARGVRRMAAKQAIVKRLHAVEGLGRVQVICTDKTGTLTQNILNIQHAYAGDTAFAIHGTGYEPTGSVTSKGQRLQFGHQTDLDILAQGAMLFGDSTVRQDAEGDWHAAGDPVDAALFTFARRYETDSAPWHKLEEEAFSYQTKRRSGRWTSTNGTQRSWMVGSPESVYGMCSTDQVNTELHTTFTAYAKQGLRIIAFATRSGDHALSDTRTPWTCLGFVAMGDEVRPEVKQSIAWCQEEHIRVVMITGDHPDTALAIAKQTGIATKQTQVLNGSELEHLSPEELQQRLQSIRVFARISPEHKLRIVQAYQAQGLITAMTGDGVNDAPALHQADIGIAMGKSGTDVAREAADLILLDDHFATIVTAIQEGRAIIGNIRKVLTYLFSTSVAEALVLSFAVIANLPLPLLPVQILWLNLVTDGFLDVALAAEPTHKTRQPHASQLLDGRAFGRILLLGCTMSIGTLFVFISSSSLSLLERQTLSLLVLAMFQWMNAWSARSETTSLFRLSLFSNPYLIAATFVVCILQLLALYTPLLQKILHTVPLGIDAWGLAFAVTVSVLIVDEIWKRFHTRKTRLNPSPST